MTHLSKVRLIVAVMFLFLVAGVQSAFAQTHTPRYLTSPGTTNSNGFYEYLPEGYSTSGTQTYPLIIFIHGMNEKGDGSTRMLPLIVKYGLPKTIQSGIFPKSFTVNGQVHRFIVISPQFKSTPTPADINAVLSYSLSKYRVNSARVYVTGLSMGGGTTWNFAADVNYNKRLAAAVPICGAASPNTTKANVIADSNIPIWATHNDYDSWVPSSYTKNWLAYILARKATAAAKKSIWASSSHDAWTKTYNPTYKENNMNVYEWMLTHQKGVTTSPVVTNQPPAANAGADKTITLPTASVSLSGSGSDADGSIVKYAWTKISGPTSFSISSPAAAVTSVSGLVQGTYVFRLTVTDNAGATGYDDVTVTVNGLANAAPVANAGSDKSITLPTSSLTLAGSATDGDGTISKYAWTKVSGGAATIASPAAASTSVSGLVQGTYVFRLTVTDNAGATDYDDVAVTVNPAPTTSTTSKVEAENYAAMYGVQKETTTDLGGGLDVGYIDLNDWIEYDVNVATAGTQAINFRIASGSTGAKFVVKNSAGTVLTTVTVPNTGGWQAWKDLSASVTLPAGAQKIRFQSATSYRWNINWFDLAGGTTAASSTETAAIKVEAETWTDSYGVKNETTTDAGGGQNVGYIDTYDWMDYKVSVAAAGTYSLNLRLASGTTGAKFEIRDAADALLTTVTVPNTGGWQSWQNVAASVSLPAGTQTLKFRSITSNRWNFNFFELASGDAAAPADDLASSGAAPSGSPIHVEAEDFDSQYGVRAETTKDLGGGQNIGYIDINDWMDYTVDVPAAGTYSLKFRIASGSSGSRFVVKNAAGQVLATVYPPNTGGWQTWKDHSVNVNLPAGAQKIRLQSATSYRWNLNWFELSGGETLSSATASTGTMEASLEPAGTMEIYPQQVEDQFLLKVNTSLTGIMKVTITNNNGVVVKSYSVVKSAAGLTQTTLSAGTLAAGSYTLKVQLGEWTSSTPLTKL